MAKTIEVADSFQAMNTEVNVILSVPESDRDKAEFALRRSNITFLFLEKTFSRFLPDNELALFNASAGHCFTATPLLFSVVEAPLESARLTRGIFDPTLLPEIIAAGYDRSFEKLVKDYKTSCPGPTKRSGTWLDIRLDPSALKISLPKDCSLDLGGIAKGWSVDNVGDLFAFFPGFALDAGGDIRVSGHQADGTAWTVGIANPFDKEHDLMVVEMDHGCICTSTTMKRKWQKDGVWQHHLIDPRTGKPAASGIVSATVISTSAVLAETIGKAALILGPKDGIELIESQPNTSGLLVLEDRQVIESSNFPEKVHI